MAKSLLIKDTTVSHSESNIENIYHKKTSMDNSGITWVSVLRGLTILLVAMNHVRLQNTETGECYEFITTIRSFLIPARIPTFIFVSGALLYISRIKKGWGTLKLYKDKIIRIGLPLLTTTVIGCIAQILCNSFVKHPKPVNIYTFLYAFIDYDSTPWPHRWYLMTLLTIMALYPIIKAICSKNIVCEIGMIVVLLGLYFVDFRQYADINYCYLFSLNKYIPFFCIGVIAVKHNWWKCITSPWVASIGWVLYSLIYFLCPMTEPITLLLSLLGVTSLVSTSYNLCRILPSAFSSFRNYIFQIYLFGIAFQAFVELILWQRLGCPDNWVFLFYVINLLAAIYPPVVFCRLIENINNKWIRYCFGLK